MSIFKKKIEFSQFLADLITFQFDFLENNFYKLATLADEFKVLDEKDKEEFLDKAHELVIVDILMSCSQQFYNNLSSEEVGEAVSVIYSRYLTDYKKVSKSLAKKRLDSVMNLFEIVDEVEEDTQKRNDKNKKTGYKPPYEIDGEINKQKFYLCKGFSRYCVDDDIKSKNWEGKNFAAFKFAKAFVNTNIVNNMLKDYKIIWG